MKKLISLLSFILFTFASNVYAQAVDLADAKNTCEVSGGTWTESGNGNWACCWADWGCYGCVNNICKMKCYNQRCRDANKIRATDTPRKNYQRIEGLVPAGSLAPIIPKKQLKAPRAKNTM